jgi:hemolysin-activating ACP:hemolysin acyltransferase
MTASANVVVFANRPTLADARFGADPMNVVWYLVAHSDLHRRWAVSEVERLFRPPLELSTYKLYWDRDGMPVGIATWIEMPLHAVEDLVANKLRLEYQHWLGNHFWTAYPVLHTTIVDMIALDSTCRMIVNDLREIFRGQTCFARRTTNGKRRLAMFRGYDDVAI